MVLRDVAIGGCKIPLGKVCGSGSDELCVPVVTKKGKRIVFIGVPAAIWEQLQASTSKGEFINKHIKGKFKEL